MPPNIDLIQFADKFGTCLVQHCTVHCTVMHCTVCISTVVECGSTVRENKIGDTITNLSSLFDLPERKDEQCTV